MVSARTLCTLLVMSALHCGATKIKAQDYAGSIHYPSEAFTWTQIQDGAVILYALGLLYMFFGIMQIHKLYLEPCISLFRKTKTFDDDTMDSTVVPVAVTAPETFMCLFATFFGVTDVGISAFLGSNAFTACVERGTLIFIAGTFGEIDWYTSFRDMIVYAIVLFATSMLIMDGTISSSNAILMLFVFFVYWMFMKANSFIEKFLRKTVYLHKKFRVGPRLTDAQIVEFHGMPRRAAENLPETCAEDAISAPIENGFATCSYMGLTSIFRN